jgi:hypothetical protein
MLNSNPTKENLLRLEFIVELEQSVGDGFLQATVFWWALDVLVDQSSCGLTACSFKTHLQMKWEMQ